MHKTTILCQFGLFCHQLTTISPSILNHFWWELYHVPLTQDDPTRTKFSHFPPKSKYQTYTLFDIRVNSNNIFPTDKMNIVLTLVGLPQRSQPYAVGGILQAPNRTASKTSWKLFVQTFSTQLIQNKITNIIIPSYLNC